VTLKCLEIGPGDGAATHGLDEIWETLTANPRTSATFHAHWGYETLPILDETYDLVYASHVIEHIAWYKTVGALKDVYRILQDDGVIELWTVDFAYVVNRYLDGKMGDDWRRYNPENSLMKWVNGRIFSYDQLEGHELNLHRACFDEKHLCWCLAEAGFSKPCRIVGEEPRGEDHGKVNMGVRAYK